ncbi:hypothetical protein GWN26_07550 [Candidatus Saccharibacteria bacterium]|nr:hypothetical protein [Candidatus Saccharibacteria bacterium]NIV04178.1 hypothetical protein [Calditrichia bacterium]NIS38329.1 hypothetical protein [Candidatus Saccharibacteria bacterium]NIV72114.1 hypothetical protein [Calditrichia bacterium]NIV99002.1 hypothetical protein [Candidatus Saccharibacteria bacterium]
MKKVSIKCFCKKTTAEFRLVKGFTRNVVDVLWCPFCSDRASGNALMINVTDVPELVGVWAIKYNQVVLKEADPKFRNQDDYYIGLFKSGKAMLAGVGIRVPKYRMLGMRRHFSETEVNKYLSGPDYVMIRKDGKPHKLPKDKRKGGEESYRPFKGYKS